MISFNTINSNIRVPLAYIEFDNSLANQGLAGAVRNILIIGQMLPAGKAVPATVVPAFGAGDAESNFGRGSMLARMIEAVAAVNPGVPLYALGLQDAAGAVAATGTITIGAPATAAGTLAVYIGGDQVLTGVNANDAVATIATNLAASINANTLLPVTAAAAAGVVTLTCRWKGLTGNDIDVRCNYYSGDAFPAGVTVAIVAMAAGATNPSLSTAIAAMGDAWYTDIVNPYTDAANYAALNTELASRWGGMRQIDALAWSAFRGTDAALTTFGATVNSPYMTFMGAGLSPTPSWLWAATNAAVGVEALEADPARPLQTLVLPGVLAPAIADRFTQSERNTLLYSGIATFSVARDGTVAIENQITSYQTNAQDVADPSYLEIETLATLSYLRYSTRAVITQKYPRSKLAQDGTAFAPGQAIVTPSIISAELLALATDWEAAGLIEDVAQFKATMIVEINATNPNRLDVQCSPALVQGLRVFAEQMQFVNG